MKIKAVKFFENGFMTQPFALGGEDGMDKFDASVRYRSCLQNYVIDTGKEVILVDTGLPSDFPAPAATPDATIYLGTPVKDYVDALTDLGYKPELSRRSSLPTSTPTIPADSLLFRTQRSTPAGRNVPRTN